MGTGEGEGERRKFILSQANDKRETQATVSARRNYRKDRRTTYNSATDCTTNRPLRPEAHAPIIRVVAPASPSQNECTRPGQNRTPNPPSHVSNKVCLSHHVLQLRALIASTVPFFSALLAPHRSTGHHQTTKSPKCTGENGWLLDPSNVRREPHDGGIHLHCSMYGPCTSTRHGTVQWTTEPLLGKPRDTSTVRDPPLRRPRAARARGHPLPRPPTYVLRNHAYF